MLDRAVTARPQPPEQAPRRFRAAPVLVWALPVLTAAVLGGWRLTTPALWADELATWGAVRLSWAQLWQLSGTVDAVLTPYYAVMKAWTAVAGTGTAALRLPALVATVATTAVVVALGRRLGGAPTGLVAGLIFALIPATVRYAQEARPYAPATFGAALAVLCLLRLVERPGAGRAAGYAGALAVAGACHPLGALLVVAGHAVAMAAGRAAHRRGRRPGREAGTKPGEGPEARPGEGPEARPGEGLGSRPGEGPEATPGATPGGRSGQWPGGWSALWWWAAAALVGSLPAVVLGIRGARQAAQISWITLADVDSLQGLPQNVFSSAAVGGIVLALAVAGVRRSPAALCLAGAGFVPPVLLLAAGTVVPVWVGRYVLVALPALAVLAAAGAVRAGRYRAGGIVVLAALLSFPVQLELRAPAGHAQDSARIAQVIGARQRPGDVVVFPDTHPSIPWAPRDIYERYLPAPRPPDVLSVAPQRTDGRLLARECPAAACLGAPPRVWVVRADNAADPLKDMAAAKRARIGGAYRPVQRWSFPLLGITLMERVDR